MTVNEVMAKEYDKRADISAQEVAYTRVASFEYSPEHALKAVKSILTHGLLGSTWDDRRNRWVSDSLHVSPRRWYDNARGDKKRTQVFFNILGRSSSVAKIRDSYYMGGPGRVAFTFDLSSFTEEKTPGQDEGAKAWDAWFDQVKNAKKMRYFQVADHSVYPFEPNHDGLGRVLVDSEYGFTLFPRVAPRYLTGIVLALNDTHRDPRESGELGLRTWSIPTENHISNLRLFRSRVDSLVDAMRDTHEKTNGRSPVLPIYEAGGEQVW